VAYVVHKIAYKMQNGSSETGLGNMEQYQRERAEARLKMLGFDVTYELTQLQRDLPSLEDENQRDATQKSGANCNNSWIRKWWTAPFLPVLFMFQFPYALLLFPFSMVILSNRDFWVTAHPEMSLQCSNGSILLFY